MNDGADLVFDVAVIGGGPAGIGAAVTAARSGATVGLIDDNPRLGGQIWRSEATASSDSSAEIWLERLRKSTVKVITGAQIFHADGGRLTAESKDAVFHVTCRNLVLATGARELFLPFPGWTLPNVVGAGALQALVKSGLNIGGKRIVIGGTGPLLLAVASYIRKHGAEVLCICEQTTWPKLVRFGLEMSLVPGKAREAWRVLRDIGNVPYWKNSWPVSAIGEERLEAVRISHNGRIRELECNYLACGFHLVPNVEFAKLIGCRLRDGSVEVNDYQQTSISHVYCAGEPTGIGGVELALLEGQVAGYAAASREDRARGLFRERAIYRSVVRSLKKAFPLRSALKTIAQPSTLICRCEDVPIERAREFSSWRAAKLHSRCGMGPCQGRVCGAAAEFLFGWNVESIRPPLFPSRCSSLAAIPSDVSPVELRGGSR
jgi:NADPH-dependent 2,4-dienoyl-CoA reductase/sulfur reductase-like enzyme